MSKVLTMNREWEHVEVSILKAVGERVSLWMAHLESYSV